MCVMLDPTAMTPCTPRFIIPGVMKKAPPLPMNPLSVPPMNPSITTCRQSEVLSVMNRSPISISPIGYSTFSIFRNKRVAVL